MAGFQFVRIETYSRKCRTTARQRDRQRTGNTPGARKAQQRIGVSELADELMRQPEASPHVPNPEPPRVLDGMDPREIDALLDERRQERRRTLRRTGIKPPRQDTHMLEGAVASFPTAMHEMDDQAWEAYRAWRDDAVAFFEEDMRQRGVEPLSVVEHFDENHPHIHILGTPTPEGSTRLDARQTHPGHAAAAQVEDTGQAGNAYRQAMREWQNRFYDSVSVPHGQTRVGPQRRRLTRRQWRQEQAQAEAVAEAQARACEIADQAQGRAARIEAMASAIADAQLAEADDKLAAADDAAIMGDESLIAAQQARDAAERDRAEAATQLTVVEEERQLAAQEKADAARDRGWGELQRLAARNALTQAAKTRIAAAADRAAARREHADADRERRQAERIAEQARADREHAKQEKRGAQRDWTNAAAARRTAENDQEAAARERRQAEQHRIRYEALQLGIEAWMDGRIRSADTNERGARRIRFRDEATADEITPTLRPAWTTVWRWIRDVSDHLGKKLRAIADREAAVDRRERVVADRERETAPTAPEPKPVTPDSDEPAKNEDLTPGSPF